MKCFLTGALRFISLLLVCAILLSVIAACGPGKTTDTQTDTNETDKEATETMNDIETGKTETDEKAETDRQTESETEKKTLTSLEKVTDGITTEAEPSSAVAVIDATLYIPLNEHGGAYYSEKNETGTPSRIEPLISDGKYGKCFVYDKLKLRNGWFFRCGSNQGAFRVSLSSDSVVSFWVYVSNRKVLTQAEFELGSNQYIDQMEKEWGFLNQLKKDGWNHVTLNLSPDHGALDLSSVSRFRVFFLSSSTSGEITVALDEIQITKATDLMDEDDLSKATQDAKLVVNPFDSSCVHVADIDLTKEPYSADSTGNNFCTAALKKALADCRSAGGGTVYLPAGTYLVKGAIDVPANVTLLGDFKPLGESGDRGTVLKFSTTDGYIKLNTSSGVEGVTVYYADQTPDNFTACAPTFQVSSGSFIKDVNLVNSYDAYAIETAHGMLTVDGLYGTVLHRGFIVGYAAEIDVFENIDLSPKYWPMFDKSVKESDLRNYMSNKSTYGMHLWGDEGTMVMNMVLDGFNTGIYTSPTKRGDGAEVYGQFCNVEIKNAKTGVFVETAYVDMGDEFAYCKIEGSEASFVNQSKQVVKFLHCELTGPIQCASTYYKSVNETDGAFVVPSFDMPESKTVPLRFYNAYTEFGAPRTGKADASLKIQEALDRAHAEGGGYVYIPGGEYLMKNPLVVYSDTILIGANPSGSYDSGGIGTTLFADWGKDMNSTSDRGLITLTGENNGVCGIRIHYIRNGLRGVNDFTYDSYAPGVVVLSNHAIVRFVTFYNAANGVRVKGAEDVFLYRVTGGLIENGIMITESKNVRVDALLSNLAGQHSSSYDMYQDYPLFDSPTLQEMGTKTLMLITVEKSEGVEIVNSFSYKPKRFLTVASGTVTGMNIYGSRMGNDNVFIYQTGGFVSAANIFIKFTYVITAKKSMLEKTLEYHLYNIKGQGLPVSDNDRNHKV